MVQMLSSMLIRRLIPIALGLQLALLGAASVANAGPAARLKGDKARAKKTAKKSNNMRRTVTPWQTPWALHRLAERPGGPKTGNRQLARKGERVLRSGAEALTERLRLIKTAKKEIEVHTTHIAADRVGWLMLASLRSAARRGVKVRLLVDSLGLRELPKGMLEHLGREGIEIVKFKEPYFRNAIRLLVLREEIQEIGRQFMVVDGKTLIEGSRALAGPFFGYDKKGEQASVVHADIVATGREAEKASTHYWLVKNGPYSEKVLPDPKRLVRPTITLERNRLNRYERLGDKILESAPEASE